MSLCLSAASNSPVTCGVKSSRLAQYPPPCPWLVVRWPVLANLLCIGIVHCCGAALCDGIGSENVPCGAVGSWDGLELFGYVPDAMS